MRKTILMMCCLLTTAGWAQILPYQNPNLSSEQRAKDLVSRLTLKEKADLMCDVSKAIPRLGIKQFNWWSEALHGFANQENVTVFPEPIGMAASFNDNLVYKVFNAVSDETRARYNENKAKGKENVRFSSLSVWTPNINIFRDPRWGRGQETYGEDPYLTSRMGVSVIKGLQGPENTKYKKLLACAKHFAVHSGPEWSRHTANLNNVEPRDLWETYLPAFKASVQEAGVREVMCAYQRLDDEPCCGNNRLLQQILRDEWGFKYIVVSDCGAIADFWQHHKVSSDPTHASAKATLAGTDVECGEDYVYRHIPEAINRGLVSEKNIDEHVVRLLTGRFDLGEMDNDALVSWTKIPVSVINSKEHQTLALDMAHQTMTLLQNKENILPLKKSQKIAVIGPNADDKAMLWGNYNGTPVKTVSILEGIQSKINKKHIIYDRGCDLTEDKMIETCLSQCSIDGKQGMKATFWNNNKREGEPVSSIQITQPVNVTTMGQHSFGPGVNLENFSAKYATVYNSDFTGEIVFRLEFTGFAELTVNGKSLYKSGSWRSVPFRIPLNVEKGKTYNIEVTYAQFGKSTAGLKFNIGKERAISFDKLIAKVKNADVVLFVGGLSPQLEGEEMPILLPGFKGGDRTSIELPAVQRNCIKALKSAGKKVILINCSGSAVALEPESENCDAILQAWYGGENGGTAVADVLFGDYDPSGKLPVTFYKSTSQLPDFENYSMKGRTYRYMTQKPLFPFGYGLSYTTFKVGTAKADRKEMKAGESMNLTIPVTNSGKRDGAEVIQVYMHKIGDSEGPIKTLRAFKRIDIKSGKTFDVTMSLAGSTFEYFDTTTNTMRVTPGEYELMYGTSSDAKDLKTIKITLL